MSLFFDNKEDKKVKELRLNEEEEVARILSDKYGIGYIDLSGVSINTDALRLVPEAEAMEGNLAVFKIVGKKLCAPGSKRQWNNSRRVGSSAAQ